MVTGDLCLRVGDWNVGAGLVSLICYAWRGASSFGLPAAYPGLPKEKRDHKEGTNVERLRTPAQKQYSFRVGRIWLDDKTMNKAHDDRD